MRPARLLALALLAAGCHNRQVDSHGKIANYQDIFAEIISIAEKNALWDKEIQSR